MSQEIVAFHSGSNLIQDFGNEPSLVKELILSHVNCEGLWEAFHIIKNFYEQWSEDIASNDEYCHLTPADASNKRQLKEIGAYIIGREINKTLKNEPKIFSELSVVLGRKGKIAEIMSYNQKGEDETPKEEILELLKHLQAGLLKAKYFNKRKF